MAGLRDIEVTSFVSPKWVTRMADQADTVRDVASRYYSSVTRYTTSAFLRAKLGDALLERGVSPHIFESAADAGRHLEMREKGKRSA
ncbi:hypothetical protein CIC12_20770 [Burkholderia sp. SG-MS1]|uniref:hypothetical protein n=1 Tax=Paraburkholderia sp. SG-MS1 TaxID=2023741 RepID=UPI001446D574|nr:hypothetical protein [Paraburkholderia sp. SG-MS1]NKJ49122.1 hypothetical protein [Paraburkholderia sp. SG-MS1]